MNWHSAMESRTCLPNLDLKRDTLVLEALLLESLGSASESQERVKRYFGELTELLGLRAADSPEAQDSSRFGLAGWAPLECGSAVHLYAWDARGVQRPFLSVDISTPHPLTDPEKVLSHFQDFFNIAEGESTYKSLDGLLGSHRSAWRELAPHIVRQRLSIAGRRSESLLDREVRCYLRDLCETLLMVGLSDPILHQGAGWMHWETSGVVASWREGSFAADIYTCKTFDPFDAVRFTVSQLHLDDLIYAEF